MKAGLRQRAFGGARPAKYLLSGWLKCGGCWASFILSNRTRYQCASHHQGGAAACVVGLSVPRDRVEQVIRQCVDRDLLNPARLAEIDQCYRNRAGSASPVIVVDHAARIAELEQQIANMTDAIAGGLLSDALAARLKVAEGERGRLIATQERLAMEMLSSAAIEQRVQTLRDHLEEGGERAHDALRQIFPTAIRLEADTSGRFLWASFQDGMDKALYDQDLTALFPQVENNGSGGPLPPEFSWVAERRVAG